VVSSLEFALILLPCLTVALHGTGTRRGKTIFWSMTVYSIYLSSQCNLTAHIEPLYDALFSVLEFTCPYGQVKCKDNIQCIYVSSMCDGSVRCNDRSDEGEETCKGNRINYDYQDSVHPIVAKSRYIYVCNSRLFIGTINKISIRATYLKIYTCIWNGHTYSLHAWISLLSTLKRLVNQFKWLRYTPWIDLYYVSQ